MNCFSRKGPGSRQTEVAACDSGPDNNPAHLGVHLLMLLAATLVSTSFTVGAAITAALDPAVLTCIRFAIASILFAPWIYFRFGLQFSISLFLRASVISVCLVSFFCCMFLALRYTSALHTSVIFALVPSISGIYAYFLNREKLGRAQLLALVCGVLGVILVIFKGDVRQLFSLAWNSGDLIFLGGCMGMALYTPLVKLLHRGESMAVMTFWVLCSGCLWLFLFTGYRFFSVEWMEVPVIVWGGVLYLAVFTTIITFFLTQYSVPFLGPTRVMAYSYLYPALVLLIDLALGHGLPPIQALPGVFVILAAMFVLQFSQRQGSR